MKEITKGICLFLTVLLFSISNSLAVPLVQSYNSATCSSIPTVCISSTSSIGYVNSSDYWGNLYKTVGNNFFGGSCAAGYYLQGSYSNGTTKCSLDSGSTYNSTYAKWAYNQSVSSIYDYNQTYTGGTYNATYAQWAYNQTYIGGTYNSTYAKWAYNQTVGGGNVSGSGIAGYIPQWQSESILNNSVIYQTADKIGINVNPSSNFDVNGTAWIRGSSNKLYLGTVTQDWSLAGNTAGNLVITREAGAGNITMPTLQKICLGTTGSTCTAPQMKFLLYNDFTVSANSSYNPSYAFYTYNRGNATLYANWWPKGAGFYTYQYGTGVINFAEGLSNSMSINTDAGPATYGSTYTQNNRLDFTYSAVATTNSVSALQNQVNFYPRVNVTISSGTTLSAAQFAINANIGNNGNDTLLSASSTSALGVLTTQAALTHLNASSFTGPMASFIMRAPTTGAGTQIPTWYQFYMEKATAATTNYQIYSVGGDNYFGNGTHTFYGVTQLNNNISLNGTTTFSNGNINMTNRNITWDSGASIYSNSTGCITLKGASGAELSTC